MDITINRKIVGITALTIMVTMVLLFTAQSVFAADFVGSKDVGGSTYSYGVHRAMGMVFEAPDNISINEMSAHIYTVSSATEIRGVVYVSNGVDWDFVAATEIEAISEGWNLLSFASSVELISGETYLLAHIANGNRVLYYGGTGGGRVWEGGSIDFDDPESSGSQPVQIAYHYGAWAPYGELATEEVPEVPVPEEVPEEMDINDGLIAYFPFEDNANDVSGNNNHGAEVGIVSYEVGAVGQAATFDGESYIVASGEPFALTEWTISFWLYVDEAPPQYWYSPVTKQAVTNEGTAGNYNYAFTYYYNQWFDSQYEDCSGNNADHMMHPGQPLLVGQWYHIVSTRSMSGEYKIYLNGNLGSESDGSDEPCIESPEAPFLIGGKVTDMTYLFKGQIDELRVYGKAHDAEFVQELFNAPEYTPTSPQCPVCEPEILEIEKIVEIPVETIVYIESDSCIDGSCNIDGLNLEELYQKQEELKQAIKRLKACRVDVVHAINDARKAEPKGKSGKEKKSR